VQAKYVTVTAIDSYEGITMTHFLKNRKRYLLRLATLLGAAVFALSACGDDNSGPNTLTCGPNTGNSSISGSITVAYSASLTGSGTVTSITYATDAGDVVVNNPTLPWQESVLNVTSPAAIRATGSVTTGMITIGYNATGAGNRLEQDTATCSQINQ
jgi:hypothetical protein